MNTERPPTSAVPSALIERLKDAIEGECDGLGIDDAHAAAILAYVFADPGLRQAAAAGVPQSEAAGQAPAAEQAMLSAELPPWLLPLEVAQRIGNEYRVRVGLIQAIARAVAAASASRAYTYDEIIRYGRICWQLARATVSELEPMPAVDLIDDPAALRAAVRDGSLPRAETEGLQPVAPERKALIERDMPNPTPTDLADPMFEAIWQATKTWNVNVPEFYEGYCGLNGSHVMLILQAVRAALSRPQAAPRAFVAERAQLEQEWCELRAMRKALRSTEEKRGG
jgi:hypothetical protein